MRALAWVRERWWILASVASALLLAGYRIGETVIGSPAVWQDSEDYLAVSRHAWLSAALWTGSRPPLVPLLLKLSGSYGTYSIVEGIIGSAAWVFLAWTIGTFVPRGWRRLVVFAAILGFAASPLIAQWDWSVLSESPSLSFLAVSVGCGLWLVRRFTIPRFIALALALLVYAGLRDTSILEVALYGAALTAIGCAVVGASAHGPGRRLTMIGAGFERARRWFFVGNIFLLIALLTGVAASVSHRNEKNLEDVFVVRVFPYTNRVQWFASHGMPQTAAIDRMALTLPKTHVEPPVVVPPLDERSWRDLREWMASHGESTYLLYLLTHPAYDFRAPFARPPLTFNNASGNLLSYGSRARSLSELEDIFVPNRFVVLAAAVFACALAIRRHRRGDPARRLLVGVGIFGLIAMLMAWHGDGQEVTRHILEGDVEVRLAVLTIAMLEVAFALPAAVIHRSAPTEQ